MSRDVSIALNAVNNTMAPFRDLLNNLSKLQRQGALTSQSMTKGANGAINAVMALAKKVTGVLAVAFSAHKMVSDFNEAARALEEVNNAAVRTGLGAKSLSELRYIADLNGVAFQSLVTQVSTAERHLSQFARTGESRAADAIRALGINISGADGKIRSINELLPELAEKLAGVENEMTQVELATRIFGSSEILQIFKNGGNGIKVMAENAKSLGGVFSTEHLEAAQKYNDAIDNVKLAYMGLRANIVKELGPALSEIINNSARMIASLPVVASRAYDIVHDAMMGLLDSEHIEKLNRLWDALANASINAVKMVFYAVAEFGAAGISALPGILGPTMQYALYELIITPLNKVLAQAANAVADSASGIGIGIASVLRVKGWTEAASQIESAGNVMSSSARGLASSLNVLASVQQNVNETLPQDAANAMAEAMERIQLASDPSATNFDELVTSIKEVMSSVDGLLGVSDEMNRHILQPIPVAAKNLTDVSSVLEEVEEKLEKVSKVSKKAAEEFEAVPYTLDNVWKGIQQGVDETTNSISDSIAWASSAVRSISLNISHGLTDTLLDAITGANSLKEAMLDFASSSLRMVSQLILQMLVLRAIMGVAGAFTAEAAPTWDTKPGFIGSFPEEFNFGARDGGYIGGVSTQPVLHRADGGMVHGPNVNYDAVRALLTPGEFVLRPQAVESIGQERLAVANRTGVMPGDGGGNVSINLSMTVHLSGGATEKDAASMKRAVVAALEETIRTNPAVRSRLKAGLA